MQKGYHIVSTLLSELTGMQVGKGTFNRVKQAGKRHPYLTAFTLAPLPIVPNGAIGGAILAHKEPRVAQGLKLMGRKTGMIFQKDTRTALSKFCANNPGACKRVLSR